MKYRPVRYAQRLKKSYSSILLRELHLYATIQHEKVFHHIEDSAKGSYSDGYVIKLELPELREMISLLRCSSNYLNQMAKRINSTDRICAENMDEILCWQEKLWKRANEVLKKLAAIA